MLTPANGKTSQLQLCFERKQRVSACLTELQHLLMPHMSPPPPPFFFPWRGAHNQNGTLFFSLMAPPLFPWCSALVEELSYLSLHLPCLPLCSLSFLSLSSFQCGCRGGSKPVGGGGGCGEWGWGCKMKREYFCISGWKRGQGGCVTWWKCTALRSCRCYWKNRQESIKTTTTNAHLGEIKGYILPRLFTLWSDLLILIWLWYWLILWERLNQHGR